MTSYLIYLIIKVWYSCYIIYCAASFCLSLLPIYCTFANFCTLFLKYTSSCSSLSLYLYWIHVYILNRAVTKETLHQSHLTNMLDLFALCTFLAELEAAGWVAANLSAGHLAVAKRFGDDHVFIHTAVCHQTQTHSLQHVCFQITTLCSF